MTSQSLRNVTAFDLNHFKKPSGLLGAHALRSGVGTSTPVVSYSGTQGRIVPLGQEDQPVQTCYVLTRDLSRGGVSILHPAPLFQSQRIDLTLSDGRSFTLAIVSRRTSMSLVLLQPQ